MRARHFHATALAAAFLLLAAAGPGAAEAFTARGRFLYSDKLWNEGGYTGQEQALPIRHARVEIVDAVTQQVIGSGATDADGRFEMPATGGLLPINVFARVMTDGRPAGYEIRVVDELVRGLGEPAVIGNIHAVATPPVLAHNPNLLLDFGTFLLEDSDGTGVAQAFHILDCAVDFFDWMSAPDLLGRRPNAAEYVVYAWSPIGSNEGSNYSGHAILLSSPGQGNDTDGWSDTVILHETGHWFDDFFSRSDNPGGAHTLGDNNQNPLLSYGEGVATFHCAKVRMHRRDVRLNLDGQPVDDHLSLYGDLMIPPDSMMAGGLSFAYDFETGVAYIPGLPPGGFPLGQRGSANETNVTSAQWDLVDGPGTADETPGVDDDLVAEDDARTWVVETTYLPGLPAGNPVTVEDFYQGWYAVHGENYLRAGVDNIFLDLALMEFQADAFEPDGLTAQAPLVTPEVYGVSAAGGVVISEIDPGAQDAVEFFNAGTAPVDLTGWQVQVYVNDDTAPVVSRIYVFPPVTLNPGETVALFERGDPLNNGTWRLYAGTTPNAFNMSWNYGLDGAVVLRDALNQPVDFVRWRAADGTESTTPVPAGAAFTGLLDSPVSPFNLARDINGTDSDQASDFAPRPGTLASANYAAEQHHTLFDAGDADLVRVEAVAGVRYGFEARGFFSASDPYLELLNASGVVIGANDNADPGIPDARLDFFAGSTGSYYLRVRHVGPSTDWAAYNLVVFQRPPSDALLAPGGITATAANSSDVQDFVHLEWLNGAAYDSVRLYRNGSRIATLPGASGAYDDHADRGVYTYEVSGLRGLAETARVSTSEYAGLIGCSASDDFEAGNSAQWIKEPATWDVTPFAQAGLFGFTDSPAGPYRGCAGVLEACTENTIALFRVPAVLPAHSRLQYDQICITEHCEPTPCDLCLVEVSTDEGASWVEVARFDQASDPAWADNVADPTDWRPADIDLAAFTGRQVLVRFRLQADPLIELDGWYVDNVRINDPGCTLSAVGPGPGPGVGRPELLPPFPNPMRGSTRLEFRLPERREAVTMVLFDLAGRLVRSDELGALDPGPHGWTWDGRDDAGRDVVPGVYFARLSAGDTILTRKVMKLAP